MQTFTSEFESYGVPHSYGLVPHLSKKLCKLLIYIFCFHSIAFVKVLYNLVISITTVHIQMHIQIQYTGGHCRFRYERFINFWLRSIATRGERPNSYNVNNPQRAAHLVMFKISVGRDPKNSTTSFNGRNSTLCPMAENLTLCLHGPISTLNWLFFKILKFSGPSNLGMTSSTLQLHFLSGSLLWQMVIVISFACEHKLHQLTMHLNS